MSGKVTISESIALRVSNQLQRYGFVNACPTGLNHDGGINILCIGLKIRKPEKFLFLSFNREFIFGTLFLNYPGIGAETKKNWVLHLNGRENKERATEVATLLAEAFDVSIHVRLEQEEMPEYASPY